MTKREIEKPPIAETSAILAAIWLVNGTSDFSGAFRRPGLSKNWTRIAVRDHNGQAVAYVYFEDEPAQPSAAKPANEK